MARLEDLTRGAQLKGIRTDGPVEVLDVRWFGTSALELTYKDGQGKPGNELLYRPDEAERKALGAGVFDILGKLFRDHPLRRGSPVLDRYERLTFEKTLIAVPGQPLAAFICPGHPLLDATLDLVQERYRDLKRGAVLVDPADPGDDVRVLYYLEHSITDGRLDSTGQHRVSSRQVHFIETDREGAVHASGYAPCRDYRPLTDEERPLIAKILEDPWLREDLEARAVGHAVAELVPKHLDEVRNRREELVEKTRVAVKDRRTKEVNYWDHRAEELRAQEQAGRTRRLNSAKARQRADELQGRLKKRLTDLELERQLSALPPIVVGGALVLPAGLLAGLRGAPHQDAEARETARIEHLAMDKVMASERRLGFEPRDVSADRCGYDIESRVPPGGQLRFIEVTGRHKDGRTITVTRNEILTGFNKPEEFILAIVLVDGDEVTGPRYLLRPSQKEPDFAVTSVNYALTDLLTRAGEPS